MLNAGAWWWLRGQVDCLQPPIYYQRLLLHTAHSFSCYGLSTALLPIYLPPYVCAHGQT